jgi:adenylate kinase family enzyme
MNRIVVIGCSAAGKSTIARELGKIFGLEVVHMDKIMWKSGCQLTEPHEEPAEVVRLLENRESWIIDGNYTASLHLRLEQADLVVVIDYPRWLCTLRAMKRLFQFRGKTRPDMGVNCPEQFNFGFLKWIWKYPHKEKPELIRQLKVHASHAKIVFIRGDREAAEFLEEMRHRAQPVPMNA